MEKEAVFPRILVNVHQLIRALRVKFLFVSDFIQTQLFAITEMELVLNPIHVCALHNGQENNVSLQNVLMFLQMTQVFATETVFAQPLIDAPAPQRMMDQLVNFQFVMECLATLRLHVLEEEPVLVLIIVHLALSVILETSVSIQFALESLQIPPKLAQVMGIV